MIIHLITLIGPTASGKTSLAVALAKKLDGEIISADSRQVYRGLDIGSGKDLDEYGAVPHHLIDIVAPDYEFSVFDFQKYFYKALQDIHLRGKTPILSGGTALYVDSILNQYQLLKVEENIQLRTELASFSEEQLAARLLQLKQRQHNTTDLLDRERTLRAIEIAEAEKITVVEPLPIKIKPKIIALKQERSLTRSKITTRLKQRLNEGLIEEVERLHQQGLSWEKLDYFGLEYRFVAQHLQGKLNSNDLFQKLNTAIHQFAKKQDTWLRRLERKGHKIYWIEPSEHALHQVLNIIELDSMEN